MIRIFHADVEPLNNDEMFDFYYENISEARKKKVDSLKQRKDKNLCVGASSLIDAGLKKYNLCEKEITYGTYENQKPFIKNAPQIHFNISHSGTMAAVVFSDGEIGIDIEKIKDFRLETAKRFFDKKEYEYLLKFNDSDEQKKEFFRLWTLKESYMKFTGQGMKLPLDSFCINIEDEKATVNHGGCYFYEYNHIDGYCLAVCSDKEIIKPEIVSIGFVKGR